MQTTSRFAERLRFAGRMAAWLILSAAAAYAHGLWYLLPGEPEIPFHEPNFLGGAATGAPLPLSRIAALVAATKPPITATLLSLVGLAVLAAITALFGAPARAASRLRVLAMLMASHLLVISSVVVTTTSSWSVDPPVMPPARYFYESVYAGALIRWQMWVWGVLAAFVLLIFPRLCRRIGGRASLRALAGSILLFAAFSAPIATKATCLSMVLGSALAWLPSEILAQRQTVTE